ncbi:hypothetical protein ACR82Z_04675 [Mycoplasma sp. 6243]|uniref:hypothetical protein n=1 Tax=Mycoplasma sp. 6243 TaxID=3440865 RepID=UPI003EC0D1B2
MFEYVFILLIINACFAVIFYPVFIIAYTKRYQSFFFIAKDTYNRDISQKTKEYHINFVKGWYEFRKYLISYNKEIFYWVIAIIFRFVTHIILTITFILLDKYYNKKTAPEMIIIFIVNFITYIITDIFTFHYYFQCFHIGKKVKKHFEEKVKSSKIIDSEYMLDNTIYFNNGLTTNNYIYFRTNFFDVRVRVLTTQRVKEIFKDSAYEVFAFFIFDMHKSWKDEHSEYYQGLYFDYVNFFNEEQSD